MDWAMAGNIAQVATGMSVPCAILGLYVRYLISENNERLIAKINGTYVKKEVLIEALKSFEYRIEEHSRRFDSFDELRDALIRRESRGH